MADNKQYIKQDLENGAVLISEEVVGTIITNAVKDVEGVVSIGTRTGMDHKLWSKGMKISVSEDNEITVEFNIIVLYGYSVVSIAKTVQTVAADAIEEVTGIKPTFVNVNVAGIVRK